MLLKELSTFHIVILSTNVLHKIASFEEGFLRGQLSLGQAIINIKCVNFNFYLVFADMSYATDMHDILCVHVKKIIQILL